MGSRALDKRSIQGIIAEPSGSLSDTHFRRLAEVIRQACGINITTKKKSLVEGRMRRRMRVLNITDPNDYARLLLEGTGDVSELTDFIDAVTTNKTDFFREPKHFEFLQEVLFPQFIADRRRSIKIWSAASSIGAEAYTIAMVADDLIAASGGGIDYSILATDICTEALVKGQSALYPDSMMEPIPEEFRRRYIAVAKDPSRREFRIAPKLRGKVRFERLNLIDAEYPFGHDFDIIFLRNVLIYFDHDIQQHILRLLVSHLRLGGHLLLGHSETLSGAHLPLSQVANTIFKRR